MTHGRLDVACRSFSGSGCGTGLGLEMAKSLAKSGARVCTSIVTICRAKDQRMYYLVDIASRRRQLLDKIAAEHTGAGEIIPLTLDHSDKESIQAVVAEVSKRVRDALTCLRSP